MGRVALTTTPDRSVLLAKSFEALGLDPVVLPCIEIVVADTQIIESARDEAGRADWLVVTSPRAVDAVWAGGGMPDAQVAAVGPATADAVRQAGGLPQVVGDGGAGGLVAQLGDRVAGKSVFLPHAAGTGQATIDSLTEAGASVRSASVYEVRPVAPGQDRVDAVIFGSPSAAYGWLLSRSLDDVVIGVIGETTAAAVAAHGFRYDVMPSRPSFDELARLVTEHLRDRSTV